MYLLPFNMWLTLLIAQCVVLGMGKQNKQTWIIVAVSQACISASLPKWSCLHQTVNASNSPHGNYTRLDLWNMCDRTRFVKHSKLLRGSQFSQALRGNNMHAMLTFRWTVLQPSDTSLIPPPRSPLQHTFISLGHKVYAINNWRR